MKDKKYIAKVEFVEKAINDYRKDLIEKIEKEADKLEKQYRKENEIHEDYYIYIWGMWRFQKRIIKIIQENQPPNPQQK